jgi:hypothetical protein
MGRPPRRLIAAHAQLLTLQNRVNRGLVKAYIFSAPIALLLACSQSTAGRHETLMDRIDGALVLPAKALPLQKYARYYAQKNDGTIAIFLTAYTYQGPHRVAYGCSEIMKNGASKEVPCDPATEPKAGERHWLTIERMPDASDGGCSIINAVYDPSAQRIVELHCNGPE